MENKKEYIICAAVKRVKQRDCIKHYYNNDLYDIEIGYRHCDIFARFGDEISKNPYDQGFYTSFGRFVGRYEGMMLAWLAGQIDDKTALRSGLTEEDKKEQFQIIINRTNNTEDTYKKYFNKLYSEDLY